MSNVQVRDQLLLSSLYVCSNPDHLQLLRLPTDVQPNLNNGVYFKSWTDTPHGSPPTGGGGGGGESMNAFLFLVHELKVKRPGYVRNIVLKNFTLDNVSIPTQIYQSNGGEVS